MIGDFGETLDQPVHVGVDVADRGDAQHVSGARQFGLHTVHPVEQRT
jgi:hypothetical protein